MLLLKAREDLAMASTMLWVNYCFEVLAARARAKQSQLQVPVEVCGYAASGEFFTERTETAAVSEEGCVLELKTNIDPGHLLGLKPLGPAIEPAAPGRTWLFRISWMAKTAKGWLVSAARLDPERIWKSDFSAADSGPVGRVGFGVRR